MTRIEHRGDTGGAQCRVPTRILARDERNGLRVVRVDEKGLHRVRDLGVALCRLDFCHSAEVGTVRIVELNRTLVVADARERRCKVIDRIVLHRTRAVATGVGDLEAVVLGKFLSGFDVQGNPVSAGVQLSPTALLGMVRRREKMEIAVGKSRCLEACGHTFCGERVNVHRQPQASALSCDIAEQEILEQLVIARVRPAAGNPARIDFRRGRARWTLKSNDRN